jgi:hypothetical protein
MAQEQLSWRDNARASAAISRGILSPECADLLDRLLQKDEVGGKLPGRWGPLAVRQAPDDSLGC